MKESFRKILSFALALVVLFSTFSFTVHEHYCKNELKDVSFFVQAQKCAMDMQMKDSKVPCKMHQKKKPCCEDKSSVIEGQDELKTSIAQDVSFEQQLVVTSFIYAYTNLFEELENNVIPFQDYSPPLVVKDIQKLDEVYLI